MWEKSQDKRRAGARHARNFAAGYVKIDEYHLLRTGLRGRKRWLFCCGATLLLLIAVGNLVVILNYRGKLIKFLYIYSVAQLLIAVSIAYKT